MTVPYFPQESWADRTARRIPRQTDVLDQALGNRFGVQTPPPAGGPAGGAPQPVQPPAGAAPGAPAGGVQPSVPMAYQNPFRPTTAAVQGAPAQPPATPPAQPPAAPPVAPPAQSGMVATQGATANTVGTPPADGGAQYAPGSGGATPGQNSVMGVGNPPGTNWLDWAKENHPEVYKFFGYSTGPEGLTDAPRQAIEQYASTLPDTPGSAAWWEKLNAWAQSEEGQAAYNAPLNEQTEWEQNQPPAPPVPEGAGPQGPQSWSSFSLDPELDELVRKGLIAPSRYDQNFVEGMWRSRAEDLDREFAGASRGLDANLRQRGINDSTFGGQQHLALAGVGRDAKGRALQSLMEDIAARLGEDRSRAVGDALALRGSREGSRQFDANYELAKRFGIEDRGFRDRQFGFESDLARRRFESDMERWFDEMMLRERGY